MNPDEWSAEFFKAKGWATTKVARTGQTPEIGAQVSKVMEFLGKLTDPPDCNAQELATLAAAKQRVIDALNDGPPTKEKIAGPITALLKEAALAQRVAGDAARRRLSENTLGEESNVIMQQLAALTNPPDCNAAELLPFTNAKAAVVAELNRTGLSKETFTGPIAKLMEAAREARFVAEEAAANRLAAAAGPAGLQSRKEQILAAADKISAPAGSDGAQQDRVKAAVQLIKDALAGAPSADSIKQGGTRLGAARQLTGEIEKEIAALRARQALQAQLLESLKNLKGPNGPEDDLKPFTDLKQKAGGLLAGAPSEQALADAGKLIADAPAVAEKIAAALEAREERRLKLDTELKALKNPDHAEEAELTPLKDLRTNISGKLTGIVTDPGLDDAQALLLTAPTVIQGIAQTVQKRLTTVKDEIIAEADQLKVPDNSSAEQKKAVEDAIQLPKTTLGAALAPGLFVTAREQLKTAVDLIAATQKTIDELAKKRIEALQKYTAIGDPAGANGPQLQRFTDQKKKVVAQLPTAGLTEEMLVEAGKEQTALEALLKTLAEEIAERQNFERRSGEVVRLLETSADSIPGPCEAHLRGLLAAAQVAASTAVSKSEWAAAVKKLDDLGALAPQAADYFEKHDKLNVTKSEFINSAPGPEQAGLNATWVAAEAKAATHAYVEALQKLNDFASTPSVAKVGGFYDELAAFRKSAGLTMRKLMDGGEKPRALNPDLELKAVKDICIGSNDPAKFKAATDQLKRFEQRVKDADAYVARVKELTAYKASGPYAKLAPLEKSKIDTALANAAIIANAQGGDITAALALLNAADVTSPKIKAGANAAKLQDEVTQNLLVLENLDTKLGKGKIAGLTVLKMLRSAASHDLANEADPSKAQKSFASLLPSIRQHLAFGERLEKAMAKAAALTTAPAPDFFSTVVQTAKNKPVDATNELAAIETKIADLAAYETVLPKASATKAILDPAQKAVLALLDEGLKAADDLFKKADYRGAATSLEATLRLPELAGAAGNVGGYLELRQSLAAPFQKVHAAQSVPNAKKFLQDAWDAAEKLSTDKKPDQALAKLKEVQTLLGQAERFEDERKGARAIFASLGALKAAGHSPFTPTMPEPTLLAHLTSADTEAGKGDFAKAINHCATFRSDARDISKTAVNGHDTREHGDGVDPHSFAKHVNVTDNQLESRVLTGVPPPATKSASRLDNPEDWMATLELSTAAGKTFPGMNLTMRNPNVPHGTRIAVVVEHGRPMGSAMVARGENLALGSVNGPNKGEAASAKTASRTVKITGYTRTTSVYKFNAVKNKWVVLSQFPYTADWDPIAGKYTADIVIPTI